jgi:PST family polysaccharide transporter
MSEYPTDYTELKSSAVKSTIWVVLLSFAARGTELLTLFILADLLSPEDFGLFGLALPIVNALLMFREMGLTPALIQRKDDVDTAFSVSLILLPVYGGVLYIIVFLLAVPFANFIGNESLIPLVRALGLIIPISALGILPSAWFQREINFKRKAIPEIFSSIIGSGAMVLLAYSGLGVWSLIWGRLLTELFRTLFYWIASGIRWKPVIDLTVMKDLFKFGSTVSLGSMTDTMFYIIDRIAIGKFVGIVPNGYYTFAFRTSTAPVPVFTVMLSQVMLPVMSKLQDDSLNLVKAVNKNIAVNAFFTVPFCAGVFFFAEGFLQMFYGDKWLPAVNLFKIMSFYCFFWALIGPMINLYIAKGKPIYFLRISVLKLFLAAIGIYLVFRSKSVEAYALVFTISSFIVYAYGYFLAGRLLQKSVMSFINRFLPFLLSLIPAIITFEITKLLNFSIFIQLGFFYFIYFIGVYVSNKSILVEVYSTVKSLFISN